MLIYGSIKKNRIYQLTKNKIEKYNFTELETKESSIKNDIEEVLNNGGIVYALGKKKILKCVYLFKVTNGEEGKTLVFDKYVTLDEVKEYTKRFEEDITTLLGEEITRKKQIKKVIWEDKEIETNNITIGRYEIPVTSLWIITGAILWHVTGDVFWFLIGMSLGFSTGYAVKKSEEQIKMKKDKEKKSK